MKLFKECLLPFVILFIVSILLSFISLSGAFSIFYFGMRWSDFLSTASSLVLSSVMGLILSIAHKSHKKTFLLGAISYLVCIALVLAIGYHTLNSGFLSYSHHTNKPSAPLQKMDNLVTNAVFTYCIGLAFGATNGWIFRKIRRNQRFPIFFLVAILISMTVTIGLSLGGYVRFFLSDAWDGITLVPPAIYCVLCIQLCISFVRQYRNHQID
jgi:multisubunit Na+/H+ antiporter MnhB subunit